MSDLRELYQEVIIDHSKSPRNFYELPHTTHHAEGFNPLCGDRLTLYMKINNNIIEEISFLGAGCAISTSSASLMTEQLKGKTIAEAETLFREFQYFLTHESGTGTEATLLGKLTILSGVRDYPSRVKCATLAWHTLHAALQKQSTSISTE
ncbi:MAG: Zinc-dependent sulfurtransferase SufU [Legionellaceae bacterium]